MKVLFNAICMIFIAKRMLSHLPFFPLQYKSMFGRYANLNDRLSSARDALLSSCYHMTKISVPTTSFKSFIGHYMIVIWVLQVYLSFYIIIGSMWEQVKFGYLHFNDSIFLSSLKVCIGFFFFLSCLTNIVSLYRLPKSKTKMEKVCARESFSEVGSMWLRVLQKALILNHSLRPFLYVLPICQSMAL